MKKSFAQPPQPKQVPTQEQADRKMLAWLHSQLSHFKEDDYGRNYGDVLIARFSELIESQATFKETQATLKRAVCAIEDSQKLAMAQMQYTQSVVHQLQRQNQLLENKSAGNGDKAEPEVDLKGK
jgi:hypothetical protein